MKLIDSNAILRFLINDNPSQAEAVERLLQYNPEPILLTDVAIAEVVWVLSSFYGLPKEKIAQKIYEILTIKTIQSNREILIRTLYYYRSFNLSFIDAYLAAYVEEENSEGIYSFDKGLDKIKEVKRFEPK